MEENSQRIFQSASKQHVPQPNSMDRNYIKVIIDPVGDIFAVSAFAVVIKTLMRSLNNNKLIRT